MIKAFKLLYPHKDKPLEEGFRLLIKMIFNMTYKEIVIFALKDIY
jgi:hypothetical protein